MDVQHLSSCTRRFQIFAAVMTQTEVQTIPNRGLLDDVGVGVDLVGYWGSNEIGRVREKAFLYHQVDMTKIDVAKVDGDLLRVTGLCPQLMYILGHPVIIHMTSVRMAYGCEWRAVQEETAGRLVLYCVRRAFRPHALPQSLGNPGGFLCSAD